MRRKRILPIAATLGAGIASSLIGACGPHTPVCEDDPETIACVRNINWSQYDAAVFGEVHFVEQHGLIVEFVGEDDLYVTKLLPELYDEGYRYLALELDSSLQDEIDSYASGEMTRHEFITAAGLLLADEYWSLIDTAIELGIHVVAVSEFPGKPDDMPDMTMDEMMELTGEELAAYYNVGPNLKMTWDQREERTVENISAIYESDPGAKVIVFYGAAHADKSKSREMALREAQGIVGRRMTPMGYRLEHDLGLETYSISFSKNTKGEFDLIIDLNIDKYPDS